MLCEECAQRPGGREGVVGDRSPDGSMNRVDLLPSVDMEDMQHTAGPKQSEYLIGGPAGGGKKRPRGKSDAPVDGRCLEKRR